MFVYLFGEFAFSVGVWQRVRADLAPCRQDAHDCLGSKAPVFTRVEQRSVPRPLAHAHAKRARVFLAQSRRVCLGCIVMSLIVLRLSALFSVKRMHFFLFEAV